MPYTATRKPVGEDVSRAFDGCRRVYFGMSVSASYLEATVIAAAVARQPKNLEVLVNISQMTVSQMSLTEMTGSPQHQQQWLGEQVLNWSGIPVVHIRPTVFLQHPFFTMLAAESIARSGTVRLPFGAARTSPIDAQDVADVVAEILANPKPHVGKVHELTGPRSEDMTAIAADTPRRSCTPSIATTASRAVSMRSSADLRPASARASRSIPSSGAPGRDAVLLQGVVKYLMAHFTPSALPLASIEATL
jgi:uncharacterized protein YbjT (DUF2867 family)